MAKPLRLPGIEEQRVLDGLEIHLLLERKDQERWNQSIVQGHYLHNATLVGEQLRYAASYHGQWLALLGWSGAAWHLAAREAWIGWSEDQRRARLPLLAQNSRFLILADRAQLMRKALVDGAGRVTHARYARYIRQDGDALLRDYVAAKPTVTRAA